MTVLTAPRAAGDTSPAVRALTSGLHQKLFSFLTGYVDESQDQTSWEVTATGADQVVTIGQVGDTFAVLGLLAEITATETIDLATVGTAPTSGQTRIDRIVARLNRSTSQISVVAITGTPATTGSAVAPALVRDGSTWDAPLARTTWDHGSGIAQGDVIDDRVLSPDIEVPPVGSAAVYANAAARDAASTADGALAYLSDVDLFQVRLDGAWVTVAPSPGDEALVSTFAANWSNYLDTLYVRKEGDYVHLEGIARRIPAGAFATAMLTLPSGYRPSTVQRAAHVVTQDGATYSTQRVTISTSGVVTGLNAATVEFVHFDVRFRA